MNSKFRAMGRSVVQRIAPTVMASISDVPRLRQEVRELSGRQAEHVGELERLRGRVAALESEIQECRRMSRRVGEVTDVVEEVLLPAASRDDARLDRALSKYRETL